MCYIFRPERTNKLRKTGSEDQRKKTERKKTPFIVYSEQTNDPNAMAVRAADTEVIQTLF